MGAVCWASNHWLLADWATQAFWSKTLALFGTVFVAGFVFLAVASRLKIDELNSLTEAVRRRLRRAT